MPSVAPNRLGEGMDVLELREAGESDQFYFTLEEGELEFGPDDPSIEEAALSSRDTDDPKFDSELFKKALLAGQFSANGDWVDGWSDGEEFLRKRYGLLSSSDQQAHGKGDTFPMRLGLPKGPIDLSAADLFDSFTNLGPLPRECDLSPDCALIGDEFQFPHRSPNSILNVCHPDKEGYIVTISDGAAPSWKLLIKDPLTVIQIEREGWHLQRDGLVLSLVRKGLPFEILYPACQRGTAFYPHPGPVIHPDGKSPTIMDYLAYRLDVADFFKLYPHAHAAALCAGGILWRVAVDALPLPDEHKIIRAFHPNACHKRMVNNQNYWTPVLTVPEQEVIIGMYKWAGKLSQKKKATDK